MPRRRTGPLWHLRGGVQSDGENHHVEGLGDRLAGLGNVAKLQIVCAVDRVDGVNPASDETDAALFPGVVVEPFEFLSVGPHVHEEHRAVQIVTGVLLGNDRFFDGVHAAHR